MAVSGSGTSLKAETCGFPVVNWKNLFRLQGCHHDGPLSARSVNGPRRAAEFMQTYAHSLKHGGITELSLRVC